MIYDGDGGNFGTYRNQVQGGGTHNALDYYAGFSDLQTTNSLAGDNYHDVTSSANLGYAVAARTNLRVSARDSVSAAGVPGQYVFTRVANDAKQNDQNVFSKWDRGSYFLRHLAWFVELWTGEKARAV